MLTIRKEQMEAFQRDAVNRFRANLESLIAELQTTPGNVTTAAQSAMDTARDFHIRRECDIASLVEVVYRNALSFPLPPLPKPLLGVLWDYNRPVADKLEHLQTWAARHEP